MIKTIKVNKGQLIREIARERIGKVPSGKVIKPKTKKQPKHKPRDYPEEPLQ